MVSSYFSHFSMFSAICCRTLCTSLGFAHFVASPALIKSHKTTIQMTRSMSGQFRKSIVYSWNGKQQIETCINKIYSSRRGIPSWDKITCKNAIPSICRGDCGQPRKSDPCPQLWHVMMVAGSVPPIQHLQAKTNHRQYSC